MIISATEVQNNFGKYLEMSQYEEVVITKHGTKVAKLMAYTEDKVEGRWLVSESAAEFMPRGVRMTYDDYLKISSESENRFEYIDGEVLLLASPLYPHQKAVKEIFGEFILWFRDKKCEPLVSPFDVTLYRRGDEEKINVVQPDILVICDPENINEEGKYHGIPTLVVEVLSDSTKSRDLVQKLDLYMESGVREYWIVNTPSAQMDVYTFEDYSVADKVTFKGQETVTSVAFPGLGVELDRVFADATS